MTHLEPILSQRGFKHLPSIPSVFGGGVRVYESSSAEGPRIWLNATCPEDLNNPEGPQVQVVEHLSAHDAKRLAEQIMWLLENHYYGDVRDEPPEEDEDD